MRDPHQNLLSFLYKPSNQQELCKWWHLSQSHLSQPAREVSVVYPMRVLFLICMDHILQCTTYHQAWSHAFSFDIKVAFLLIRSSSSRNLEKLLRLSYALPQTNRKRNSFVVPSSSSQSRDSGCRVERWDFRIFGVGLVRRSFSSDDRSEELMV